LKNFSIAVGCWNALVSDAMVFVRFPR